MLCNKFCILSGLATKAKLVHVFHLWEGKSTSFPFVILTSTKNSYLTLTFNSLPCDFLRNIPKYSYITFATSYINLRIIFSRCSQFSSEHTHAKGCWNDLILFIRVIILHTIFLIHSCCANIFTPHKILKSVYTR